VRNEHEAAYAGLLTARETAMHGLANSLHVLIAGVDELGPLSSNPEVQVILGQMREAGSLAAKHFAALRGLL
jgi:hypothetical protein